MTRPELGESPVPPDANESMTVMIAMKGVVIADAERKKPANAAVIDVFVGGAFDSTVMAVMLRVTHAIYFDTLSLFFCEKAGNLAFVVQDPPLAKFGTTLPHTSAAEDAKHPQFAFRNPVKITMTDLFTASNASL
ncbi:hypothetical protein CTAM01_17330 [Colletotrichum tamarilloi]|uniref:Uncharacterized protein n=1 Tax=Colletotrichum tamarilloi TaxID=1209934 RepID=A0ABQ9QFX8_9PEZI|nr:uncharacterized protein CTAM01_17330 [Colletotrichum tamarilloi]KAK1450590.1 hypothetical protein CTAM01_17330 [Colletotrichum tamarilloi]